MAISVNHNLLAANVARSLNVHYLNFSQSTQRLSTGLRINGAADDAAGLAIRELQRADIAALTQGVRNANDAISLIQTADGAIGVIDEKLIRMIELSEQAATGTYNSTQRLMIDSEFHAMALEIDRIANATDFNGIKLLDGTLKGVHDGSQLESTGELKVHFGASNASAEDYYYIQIGDCTTRGLGLKGAGENITPFDKLMEKEGWLPDPANPNFPNYYSGVHQSGIIVVGFVPAGSTNVTIEINGVNGQEDDIQLFTRDGYHLAGTRVTNGADNDYTWSSNGIRNRADADNWVTTGGAGFIDGTTRYKLPGEANELGNPVMLGTFNAGETIEPNWDLAGGPTQTFQRQGSADQMNITFTGDYDRVDPNGINDGFIDEIPVVRRLIEERLHIDEATEDLLLTVTGWGLFTVDVTWDFMPDVDELESGGVASIETQEKAQKMLERINSAIVKKDSIRAHLGAVQNRLENTVTNLTVQAENLQASESRISDADMASEMMTFIRNQILTQTSIAMLAQANSLAQMSLQLLNP